jgi:hypothetical protein
LIALREALCLSTRSAREDLLGRGAMEAVSLAGAGFGAAIFFEEPLRELIVRGSTGAGRFNDCYSLEFY